MVDLPTPGEPVMPTRTALPVARKQRLRQRRGGAAVIGAFAFDQRDGARQYGAVAGADVAARRSISGGDETVAMPCHR